MIAFLLNKISVNSKSNYQITLALQVLHFQIHVILHMLAMNITLHFLSINYFLTDESQRVVVDEIESNAI